jgi:hypothetical protein
MAIFDTQESAKLGFLPFFSCEKEEKSKKGKTGLFAAPGLEPCF